MNKKILQISNDFSDQKIYINLVRSLSEKGFEQVVYTPVKKEEKINGNRDDSVLNVEYFYSFILKTNIFFRIRYYKKIHLILNDIENKVNLEEVGLVHSHFLFSDGGVAYLLKKKYGIPYVVNVRASDIFTFFGKMIHLRQFGNKIMSEASQVIFINHSYLDIFKRKYLQNGFDNVLNKICVIPNAIDTKWFERKTENIFFSNTVKLLYVGRIIKRKKLEVVIKAVNRINATQDKINVTLDVVGEGDYLNKIKKLVTGGVFFHGSISDHSELLRIYNESHIFVMPSVKETFGLVYIEALSQGLPIIYCKNEGVDSFFESGEVGYSVKPNSVKDVIDRVVDIMNDYERMSDNAINSSIKFNWNVITEKYINIYNKVYD